MKCLLVLLCACNQVYGLDDTQIRHDAAIIDEDLDRVADDVDNCVGTANDNQADEDLDGVGDACDNCPLFSNSDQQDIGDGDGVGDRCDAHPRDAHDCLIVFDSFRDGDHVDDHWQQTGPGSIDARTDEISITSTGTLLLVARDEQGATLSGDFDVALVGRLDSPGSLFVGSLLSADGRGFSFGAVPGEHLVVRLAPDVGAPLSPSPLRSGKALANNLYLRLGMTNADGTAAFRVIGEYGILFVTTQPGRSGTNTGGPGLYTVNGTAVVTGFTAYKNIGASATCPAPIRR